MKKIIIFLSFIAGAIAAHAEDKVTIQTNVSDDRKGANVVVSLDNATEYVAFQIDLTFPAASGWTNTDPVITSRLQNESTTTVDGNVANYKTVTNWDGNKLRIVGYNLGDQAISGTSGEMLTVSVSNTAAVNWGTPTCSTVFVEKTELGEPVLTALPANVLVTTNGVNWATFAPSENVTVPTDENVKVHYVATRDENTVTTTILDAETALVAGEGVLVKTTSPSTTVSFPVVEGATKLNGNLLVGVLEPTTKPHDNAYIFTQQNINGENKIGFYIWNSGTLAAGKCYLDLSTVAGAPKFLVLAEDNTTNIGDLANDELTNGDCLYNLQGMKVDSNYRGIVIKNGKKHLIK